MRQVKRSNQLIGNLEERVASLRETLDAAMASHDRWAALGNDIGAAVTNAGPLPSLLQRCTEAIVKHLNAAFARVWILDEAEKTLVLRASAGMYTNLKGAHARIRLGELKIGRIAEERRPYLTNDVENDPHITDREWARQEAMTAFAGYPLIYDEAVIGVVAMFARQQLDQSALSALQSCADRIALAVVRARAVDALRESEQRFRLLADAALEGVLIHDGKTILDANLSAARILERRTGDIMGRDLADVLVLPVLKHLSAQERRRWYERTREVEGLKPDGTRVPLEVTARTIKYRGQNVRVAVLRDLTDRKRLEDQTVQLAREKAARAREALLAEASKLLGMSLDYHTAMSSLARLLVKNLADLCIVDVIDDNERVIRIAVAHRDPAVERVLCAEERGHIARAALLREALRHGAVLVQDFTNDRFPSCLRDILPGDLPIASILCVPLSITGNMNGAITLATLDAGRRYGDDHLSIATDVAFRAASAIDNARLFHAAHTATKARDDMLSIVAHDLRNPVSTIFMAADLILAGDLDDRPMEKQRHLEIIRRTADGMNRMIGDLLDVQALETGSLKMDPRCESVERVLLDATEMLRPLTSARGLQLMLEVSPQLPAITMDEHRIHQVLSNLVGNATKFTPAGGSIAVAAKECTDHVRVSVSDTGSGIRAEDLPNVFGRFWKADSKDRRGVGLGLAIAKSIVEGHGGKIWIESTVDVGTTVHFTLPLHASNQSISVESAQAAD